MDDEQPLQPAGGLSLQQARFGKTLATPFAVGTPSSPTDDQAVPVDAPSAMVAPSEPGWLVGLKALAIFALVFTLVFTLLQAPAFWSRASYALTHVGRTTPAQPLAFLPKLKDRPITLAELKAHPEEFSPSDLQFGGYRLTDLGDNQLLIPKIEVSAPIVWQSPADEPTALKNLESGVVHYDFTALPSDGRGNVFLFGHSSYTLWAPGQYKTIFANLDRLSLGDQLALTYQGVIYLYQVSNTVTVQPSDLSVLEPTDQPTLSLMTCVPVGTNRNRLVVKANLISASPADPIPLPPRDLTDPASIFGFLPG